MSFERTAAQITNRWRGFQPWPGAWTTMRGKKLIVHRLKALEVALEPGVSKVEAGCWMVGCREGAVELLEVQMEGKKRMTAEEFLRGHQVKTGEKVGE